MGAILQQPTLKAQALASRLCCGAVKWASKRATGADERQEELVDFSSAEKLSFHLLHSIAAEHFERHLKTRGLGSNVPSVRDEIATLNSIVSCWCTFCKFWAAHGLVAGLLRTRCQDRS